MNSYDVEKIKALSIFNDNVYIDNAFLLTPANCAIEGTLLKSLTEWHFTKLYSNGTTHNEGANSQNPQTENTNGIHEPKKAVKTVNAAPIQKNIESVDASEFLDNDESSKPSQIKKNIPAQEPAKESAINQKTATESKATLIVNNPEEFERAKKTYFDFIAYANKVYTFYATNKVLNNQEIAAEVTKFLEFIKTNRSYVLRIISDPSMIDKNFLINHCIRSTVVSLTIGLQLKMPEERLIELGVASFLHEIGMILLPPQLYMKDKQLSAPEKLMINTHPIVSYNILKKANFSTNVQMAVLEHHERVNGSGYPRHITGEKTSLYAKIIAVACSFEAISAPREYREERSTFEALIEMLRNSNRQYEETIIKALLYSISLYPIGVYVYLSNGKIAQVVDVTAGNPKCPFVQVLGETNAEGNPQIIQVDTIKIKIIRVLNKKEVEDALKSIKK
ncbi:MAG: HD-GYP domain-containing protein [Treponema sp.]|nr:HD-GYP domain-containing protein [Treponema sp.]